MRNLTRSWSKTLLTVCGSVLTVFIIIAAASFNEAMRATLGSTADDKNVMLIGAGSEESVERSEISPTIPGVISASIPGLSEAFGQVAVSGEIYYMGMMKNSLGHQAEALMRGVELPALLVHSQVAIIEGSFPNSGEVLVGRLAKRQMGWSDQALAVGATVEIDSQTFTVSGIFEAPNSVYEAEIWLNLSDLMEVSNRDALSCTVVKLADAEFDDVDLFCKQRLDLELSAVRESDYYAKLSDFYFPIQLMVWGIAILVISGAIFGGLNNMYASFISRKREIATLQAIGFGRLGLLWSMLIESLFLNLVATLVALVLAMLLLNDFELSFASGVFSLKVDNISLLIALISSSCLSIVGIVVPAYSALYPPLTSTLKS